MMDDMNQALANLTPEQRRLVELMLRQSQEQAQPPPNTISQQRVVGAVPLSFAQQRLWFLEQLQPGSAAYNLPLAMRVDGKLDEKALTQSLNEVVARHEVLRTTFSAEEGQPTQVIAPTLSIHLPLIELSTLSKSEQATRLQELVLEEAGQPFNLELGPLLRASLLRLNINEHLLLLTMHHSVSDGWSISILMREMAVLYHAFSTGQPSPLPSLPIQYKDYAIWQRKWLTGEVLEKQLGYWKRQLSGDLPALNLPTDHPRPLVQTSQGAIAKFQIPRELTDQLKALSQQHAATLFMVLLAAFQALLHRYTGQHDFVVGTPIANRNRSETEGLIGFFVNMLALRVDLSGNPTFSQLLQRVRKVALDAYAHQDLPFERLVDELQLKRDISRTPLFQVTLVLQNMPIPTIEAAGLKLTWLEMANSGTAKFDLTITLTETAEGLRGALEYCTDLFEVETIERLLMHYQTLLIGIVANPGQHLSELPLLTGGERHQLLVEWNATETEYPQEKCIHERFESQVQCTPDALAVVFEGAQLTYRELNERANQWAHHLLQLGVGPDVLVGICAERSLEMIVGILAILKAGGAYLPLAPEYPKDRLAFMLADAGVNILLTQQRLVAGLPKNDLQLICLDMEEPTSDDRENLDIKTLPENLAYVIYTSGSTGIPKGVAVTHANVLRLTLPQNTYARLGKDEVFLQFAPLAFDASTFEIWGSLLNGARLAAFPNHLPTPEELGRFIQAQQVTTLWLTAGLFHQMVDAAPDGFGTVSQLLSGGDVLSVPHLIKAQQQWPTCQLINGYGPTESTTFTCCYHVANGFGASVPIGRPIANTQVYLLDNNLQPVPVGVPGELYIAGAGLARGYLNRAALTAEKFIPNPYSAEAGARMYCTGDLARYLPDGNIEFLGRMDFQVKIRGFRIELGEIEAALAALPEVRNVVVLVREDTPGEKRLAAYWVAQDGDELPRITELKSKLLQSLPDYMIPTHFIQLEQLPLTPNGKIDRQALPVPDMVRSEAGYVAPRTPTEETLAQVWAEVLRLEKIGIHDNFFELGGDSLLSLRMVALANKESLHLTPKQIFQHPTLAELAAVVNTETEFQAEQGLVIGLVPLTCDQHWYLYHAVPQLIQPHRWNTSVFLQVPSTLCGEPAVALLEQAVQAIWRQHDALRARFVYQESIWLQHLMAPEEMNPFLRIDLSALTDAEMPTAIETQVEQLQNSLDLTDGPLFRVIVFDLGSNRPGRLLIIAHHLVTDGFSMSILLKDLQECYQQLAQGQPIQLPPKTVSIRQWAELLHQYAQSASVYQELDYWLNLPWAEVLPLPMDNLEGYQQDSVAAQQSLTISFTPEETGLLLRDISTFYQTSPLHMLLMALTQTITQWTGGQAVEISCPVMGRDILPQAADMDLSRTVGWLALSNVLVLRRTESDDLLEALRGVERQLQQTPNQSCGYHFLTDLRGDENISRQLKPLRKDELIFNYFGQMLTTKDVPAQAAWLSPAPEHPGNAQDPREKPFNRLYIMGSIFENSLSLTWNYSASVYQSDTIARQAQFFKETLQALIIRYQDDLSNLGANSFDSVAGNVSRIQEGQGIITDHFPITPIQRWFFEQDLPAPQHWNQAVILKVLTPLNPTWLAAAWRTLLLQHDALRLRFERTQLGWQQGYAEPDDALPFRVVDLSQLQPIEQTIAIETETAKLQASLNLGVGPLLHVAYFDLGVGQAARLFIVIHHLAVDSVSWRILLEDLESAYQQHSQGHAIIFPPKTTSFRKWAERLNMHAQIFEQQKELDYWLALPWSKVTPLPVDQAEGQNVEATSQNVTVELTEQETWQLLHEVPKTYHTQINDVLLAALSLTFAQWTGNRALLVDLEGHGREDLFEEQNLSRTVGWFTSIFPVLLEADAANDLGQTLKQVKEQLASIPQRGLGYGMLRYLCVNPKVTECFQGLPSADVSFNYLGQLDQVFGTASILASADENSGPTHGPLGKRSHLLQINGGVLHGRLWVTWTYSPALHHQATIQLLADGFAQSLRDLISHCLASKNGS